MRSWLGLDEIYVPESFPLLTTTKKYIRQSGVSSQHFLANAFASSAHASQYNYVYTLPVPSVEKKLGHPFLTETMLVVISIL